MISFRFQHLDPIGEPFGPERGHEGGTLIRGLERPEAELDLP
jgi:hypothetical protein